MRPPPEISVLAFADAILDLRRAEARHVGAVLCVHRRRFRRALAAETMDRRDLDFTLAICLEWIWAHSPALRSSRVVRPSRPVEIATEEEIAAFLEAAEAERRALLVARAVEVLGRKTTTWQRGRYLAGRVEAHKRAAAARGLSDREVRSWRAAFVDGVARQRAVTATGMTIRPDD